MIRWTWLFLLPLEAYGQITGSVTQGLGTVTVQNLMPSCPSNHTTPLGTIQSTDNKSWVVPAETQFSTGPTFRDLYNSCHNVTPASLSGMDLSTVPVVEIDPDGDTITGYLFADNYVELYINGVLVGVDPVPFTPFNSGVVRFRVSRPYTIAVKLVDWEENPGLGSEIQGADHYHPGDGGFIAQFSDGTVTNSAWRAQTFYIAPLETVSSLVELPDGTRSTASATSTPGCNANCFGVHYDIPINWTDKTFDDGGWPLAKLYTAAQVTNQAAYTNFTSTAWGNASFIWSSNLVLDNLVLARYTVPAATEVHRSELDEDRLRVYPNPARHSIRVENREFRSQDDPFRLILENSLGQKVREYNAASGEIWLGELPAGLYRLVRAGGKEPMYATFIIE